MDSLRPDGQQLVVRDFGAWRLVQEAQLGLYLACDAGWLFAWSAALGDWLGGRDGGALLGPPSLAGVLLAATVATRLSLACCRSIGLARAALALLGMLIAVLMANAVLWQAGDVVGWGDSLSLLSLIRREPRAGAVMALALLAWWRGVAAGRARLFLDTVEAGFRTAVLALVGLYLLSTVAPQGAAQRESASIGSALVVLFAGLAGLPLASVLDLSVHPRHRDGPRVRPRGHWLAMLLSTIAILLLISLLLASALTFDRLEVLLQPMTGLVNTLLVAAVYAIALPTVYLVGFLITLLRLIPGVGGQRQPFQPPDLSWLEELRSQTEQGQSPLGVLPPLVNWGLTAVLVGLVLVLFARAVFRLADWRSQDDVEEVRDFVSSWIWLGTRMTRKLRRLLIGRRQGTARAGKDCETPEGMADPVEAARALYRVLLRLGGQLGRRRLPRETPLEYERALVGLERLKAGSREIRVLTQTYNRARYAQHPPAPETVAAAQAALQRLEELNS